MFYFSDLSISLNNEINLDSIFADRRRFQDYISPGDEIEGLSSTLRNKSQDGIQVERDPLPSDVLTNNLGLDIVVAITKTDHMSVLEKDFDYKEEHFDFIQQAIRKFCLKCKRCSLTRVNPALLDPT